MIQVRLLTIVIIFSFLSIDMLAQETLRVYTSEPEAMTDNVTGGTVYTEGFSSFTVPDANWAPVPGGYDSPTGTYTQTITPSTVIADDQYGAGTGNYLSIPSTGSEVTLVFDQPIRYFAFAWSAGDGENTIKLIRDNQVMATFTTDDVIDLLPNDPSNIITAVNGTTYSTDLYYGKPIPGPNTQNLNEPYAFLHYVATEGLAFDAVVFSMGTGGAFENDNHTILIGDPEIQGEWVELIEVNTPTANDDSGAGSSGVPVVVDVLDNDVAGDAPIDPTTVHIMGTTGPGDPLVVSGEGTWSVNASTGAITFTPEAGFLGSPTPIEYEVTDNDGFSSNEAEVTVTYLKANDDSGAGSSGDPVVVDVLDNDVAGDAPLDPASVQIATTTNPGDPLVVSGEGTWSVNTTTGAITFTPEAGFLGSPTPIDYTVKDDDGYTSNEAEVTVTYLTANDDSGAGSSGDPVVVDVLDNDVAGDAPLDPASVQIATTTNPGDPLVVSGEGTWSVNTTTGAITFTPEAGFLGSPTPIDYTVKDDDGYTSNEAEVTVTYLTANDDSGAGSSGDPVVVDVLDNDVAGDAPLDPASVQIATTTNPGDPLVVSGEGTWSVNTTTGAITFTPEAGFLGSPTPIDYTVKDDDGYTSNEAEVTVTYLTANDDSGAGSSGDPVVVDVLDNDVAGDAPLDPASVQIATTTNPGDPLVVSGEGTWSVNTTTGAITFTPEAGFLGSPTPIDYTVKDDDGYTSNEAEVTVTYLTANDDSGAGSSGDPVVVDVLDNDVAGDAPLDPATVQIATTTNPGDPLVVSGEGTWSVNTTTGAITFTPEAGFLGSPTPIDYTVKDDDGYTSNEAEVTVTYLKANDDSGDGTIGDPVVVDVLDNDVAGDAPLDPASVQIATTTNPGDPLVVSGEGTWSVNTTTGAITFTPESGFLGSPTPIAYTVKDDDGYTSNEAEVTVTYEDVADLQMVKTVSNSTPKVGVVVTFTLTITNLGPDDATGVDVEDVVPSGYSSITNISNGGSESSSTISWPGLSVNTNTPLELTFDVTVDAPTGTSNEYLNTATITDSDQYDPDTDNNEDTEDVTPQSADLQMLKTVSNSTPKVGDVVTFTLTITNLGADDASGVDVEDVVPDGYSNITAISNSGSETAGTISWTGLSVTTATPLELTFDATVDAPTGTNNEYLNAASITDSDQYDPNTDNNEDTEGTTPQIADLQMVKTVSNSNPNVGDVITFTLTIANLGTDDATEVDVEDVVPAGYSSITNISNSGSESSGTISWSGLSVTTSTPLELTFDATVDAPTGTNNEYLNSATITDSDQYDPDTGNNEDTEGISPQSADLQMIKTVSNKSPNVGDEITFTLTITNLGPDDATGVDVEDVVPSGYSGITNISNGGSESSGTISWSSLSVTTSIPLELTFDVTINTTTGTTNEYLNTATITDSDQYDPDPGNNEDTEGLAKVIPVSNWAIIFGVFFIGAFIAYRFRRRLA